jgi:hypothetical protein
MERGKLAPHRAATLKGISKNQKTSFYFKTLNRKQRSKSDLVPLFKPHRYSG